MLCMCYFIVMFVLFYCYVCVILLLCLCIGVKQNRDVLGDVVLPPWAKGDPLEFIRVNREVKIDNL